MTSRIYTTATTTVKAQPTTISGARVQHLTMTFISVMMVLFALAAATQLSSYWAAGELINVTLVATFNLFAFSMLAFNGYQLYSQK